MGININGINWSNIILISKYITYSILSWFTLHKDLSILLARNCIGMTEHMHFLMRGIKTSFCDTIDQKLVIVQIWNGYRTRETFFTWGPLYSNSKPILFSTIILTLKLSSCSVLAPGMQNNDSNVLFSIFCAVKNVSMNTQ